MVRRTGSDSDSIPADPLTDPSAPPPSFWEDFVDIFYAPSAVFARRREGKFGYALLFLTIAGAVLIFLTKNAMQPVMDAEFAFRSAEMMRQNPQMTSEQMAQGRAFFETFGPVIFAVVFPIGVILVGIVLWVTGKLFECQGAADGGDHDLDVLAGAAAGPVPPQRRSGAAHFAGEDDFGAQREPEPGAVHGSDDGAAGGAGVRVARGCLHDLDHGAAGDRTARGGEDPEAVRCDRGGDHVARRRPARNLWRAEVRLERKQVRRPPSARQLGAVGFTGPGRR